MVTVVQKNNKVLSWSTHNRGEPGHVQKGDTYEAKSYKRENDNFNCFWRLFPS